MAFMTATGHGNFEDAKHHWGWLLALGVLLIVLGLMASSMAMLTSLVTVVFLGSLLLISGVAQIVSALRDQSHGSFWLNLLAGVLDIVVGGLLISRPLAGVLVLTLMLAIFFFVGGIYHALGALSLRYPGWGWAVLSGVVDIILAIFLVAGWPVTGLWFLGFCVGVGLIFRGVAWVMFSSILRKNLPAVTA